MEVNVNELIQTIKNDGIEKAKQQEKVILTDAEKKAAEIIANAKKEASSIVADAEKEADRFIQSGNAAVKQAGRDLILKLEDDIKNIFESILKDSVSKTFSGKVLEDSVVKAVEAIADDSAQLDVLVSDKDLGEIEKGLKNALKKKCSEGLEIKPFKNLQSGFRIAEKDGSSFYDFSAAEITEMIAQLVNRKIAELLK